MKKITLALLCLAGAAYSQTIIRVDPTPVFTVSNGSVPGYYNILGISYSTILLKNPNGSVATTYSTFSGSSPCALSPTPKQVVTTQGTCQSTTDVYGDFGFWIAAQSSPVTYNYTVTNQLGTFGPFYFTVTGLGGGGGSTITPTASYTVSGNTTELGTVSGALGAGDCAQFDASRNIVDSGGACGSGSGPVSLATSFGWVCDGTTVNANSVITAMNTWMVANPNGTIYWPTNSSCLYSGFTSNIGTINSMLVGVKSTTWVGTKTALINTQESGSNNINLQIGQGEFTCFSGPIVTPTVNDDFTASPINTVAANSTTVTATVPSSVASWNVGDYVMIYGFDQQDNGFPPNYRYFERHYIQAINHSTGVINLDSPLQFRYNSKWFFDAGISGAPTSPPSIRDLSITCTGGGNLAIPDRVVIKGFDLSKTISGQSGQIATTYGGGAKYVEYDNVQFGELVPSDAGTIVLNNTVGQWAEYDKLLTNIICNNCLWTGNAQDSTQPVISEGTGVLNAVFNNSTFLARTSTRIRNSVWNNDTFYSQSASPYAFLQSFTGYAVSSTYTNPLLIAQGVQELGITGAAAPSGAGSSVQAVAVTGNTFTVSASNSTSAPNNDLVTTLLFAGEGTLVQNHSTGAVMGTVSDVYLNSGVLTIEMKGPIQTAVVGNSGGSGYGVNDILTIVQAGTNGTKGCFGATVIVTAAPGGVVSTVAVNTPGTSCLTGTNLATTSGFGTGATINITAIVGIPTATQIVDFNPNTINVTVTGPVAQDFDINSMPPVFAGSGGAFIPNLFMQYQAVTTVQDLGPCNFSSGGATKTVRDAQSTQILGSGGGTFNTSVVCQASTSTWIPISPPFNVPLNSLATATGSIAWNTSTFSFQMEGTTPASTSGNGSTLSNWLFIATPGQSTTGTTSQTPGTGTAIQLTGGTGGSGNTGSAGNANGGPVVLQGGPPGSGTGAAGTYGSVQIQTLGGNVDIGGISCSAVSYGLCLANGVFQNSGSYTLGTSASFNGSAGANMTVPSATSYVWSTNGQIGFNSTTNLYTSGRLGSATVFPWANTSPAPVNNNCVKWGNSTGATFQLLDAGAPCGSGGGGFSPSPAIGANMLLTSDGAGSTYGFNATGPSGGTAVTSGQLDIVTSVVPRLSAANTFTGVNKFSQLQVNLFTVSGLPTCNSSFEGQFEGVTDASSPTYNASLTGSGSSHIPVYCDGTIWRAH